MKIVSATKWNTMSASHILFYSMPDGEQENWITWTNIKVKRHCKLLTNEKELKLVLGIFFAVTQKPKKGGIVREFDECSDGLFTNYELGELVLKHWCFKHLFYFWTYVSLDYGNNKDQTNPY